MTLPDRFFKRASTLTVRRFNGFEARALRPLGQLRLDGGGGVRVR